MKCYIALVDIYNEWVTDYFGVGSGFLGCDQDFSCFWSRQIVKQRIEIVQLNASQNPDPTPKNSD